MRAAVFIDGGYVNTTTLAYLQGDQIPGGGNQGSAPTRDDKYRLDYKKFVQECCSGGELISAHYYDCVPDHADVKFNGRRKFVDALSSLPRFNVHLGRLEKSRMRGNDAPFMLEALRTRRLLREGSPEVLREVMTTLQQTPLAEKQKRVDVHLAIDLVEAAYTHQITGVDTVVLVCSDSDLIPAVRRVQDLGLRVHLMCCTLFPKTTPGTELMNIVDRCVHITVDMLEQCRHISS